MENNESLNGLFNTTEVTTHQCEIVAKAILDAQGGDQEDWEDLYIEPTDCDIMAVTNFTQEDRQNLVNKWVTCTGTREGGKFDYSEWDDINPRYIYSETCQVKKGDTRTGFIFVFFDNVTVIYKGC